MTKEFLQTHGEDVIERLKGLPPSAKLVYKVLQYSDGPLSHTEIVEETRLPKRTVRYGTSRLKDADLVEETRDVRDARLKRFYVHEERKQ